jgi:glycosyltransferase involved in cell wall biosynthesis
MSRQPVVSVIIPTYNRAEVICETIENILAQTYRDTEIIVVDDGSTDDTQLKLKAYGNRIRIFLQDNSGASAARNRGIEMSTGSIIAFQDSDDLWKDTKLERQVALLSKLDRSIPCCLCNAVMRNLNGNPREQLSFDLAKLHSPHAEGIWLNVSEVLATRFVLFNQTAAIRRDALEKAGGFDFSLKHAEDYDLSLKLSLQGPWAFISEPLTIWRGGAANSLSKIAVNENILLKHNEIRIVERALRMLADLNGGDRLQHRFETRLKIVRRCLRIAELRQAKSLGIRFTGNILDRLEQYRFRAATKLMGLPVMNTVSTEQFLSSATQPQL